MRKSLVTLVIATIIGAILGFLLTDAINNGWFSSQWKMIEKPPSKVDRLAAVSNDNLWVQTNRGTLYLNTNASSCKAECWQQVTEIPTLPIIEPYEASVTNTPCAPAPPLIGVKATISECRKEMWIDRNYIFALRSDGAIYLWQADLYREWSAVLIIMGVSTGAIALFTLTLIIVILNWLSNRIKEKQREKIPSAA
jgi:hypothetical protein